MTKSITLCADDYALHPAISMGILHLATMKRVTAVTCLTTTPYWPEHAKWLYPHRDHLAIGLHINLTDGKLLHLARQSLIQWLYTTAFKRVEYREIEKELSQQLETFVTHFQRLPDFVDGHQYVHHLPVVRKALFNLYEKHLRSHLPYVRVALQRSMRLKPWLVAATGAVPFAREAAARGIPYNSSFSGIYPFRQALHYRQYFLGFLRNIRDKGIIACHPAFPSPDTALPWAQSRALELAYLQSDAFNQDCRAHRTLFMKNPKSVGVDIKDN